LKFDSNFADEMKAMKPKLFILLIFILLSSLLVGCSDSNNDSNNPASAPVGSFQQGTASWYGAEYHGRRTASGEIFDKNAMTAAHKELAFNTYVEVTNLENGRKVVVKINDRGPFVTGRIIDLSERAADELGMKIAGLAEVSLKIVSE
jgi:rare lipoprotein A